MRRQIINSDRRNAIVLSLHNAGGLAESMSRCKAASILSLRTIGYLLDARWIDP